MFIKFAIYYIYKDLLLGNFLRFVAGLLKILLVLLGMTDNVILKLLRVTNMSKGTLCCYEVSCGLLAAMVESTQLNLDYCGVCTLVNCDHTLLALLSLLSFQIIYLKRQSENCSPEKRTGSQENMNFFYVNCMQ